MTLLLVLAFGVAMSIMMIGYVIFYRQAVAARNSAIILARVMPSAQASDDLYARAIKPERLAKSPRIAALLVDAPMFGFFANLLEEAGVHTSVAEMLGQMAGVGATTGVLGYSLGCSGPGSGFLALVASAMPIAYYYRKRSLRVQAFEAQLPQMLELLTLYLRTGRSLPQAFTAVAEEIPAPANEELAICAEEYRLGRPLPVALKGLAQKYPESLGLRLFSIAISVLGQTGGNLVEVLDRIKRTLDASISYVLKLRAMTGEARTSATILGIVPGVFMVFSAIGNPRYFNAFFESATGLVLLGLFVFFWASGVVWIQFLMRSKA